MSLLPKFARGLLALSLSATLLSPLHSLRAQEPAAASGPNLLLNGNLEADAKGDGWPDHWPKMKTGGAWVAENGNHFLRLTAATPGQMVMMYRTMPLPAGAKALQLTWRQRVTDIKPGKENYFDARVLIEFTDAAGKKVKGSPSPSGTRKATEGWVEKKSEFLVPEDAKALVLMPALFQVQKGTYDLDDFVLQAIEPASLAAKQEAREAERKAAEVPIEQPQKDKWPQELHVQGNQILNKDGKVVHLQGVNVDSLEWNVRGEQIMKSALVAVQDWKSNIIRLPVHEDYWFGKDATDQGAAYRALVDNVVTLVANRGAYVLFDLHRFKAPRQEHADFWKDAAEHFKNHPAVLFDLFNEPHGTTWEVWRNGGLIEQKKKPGEEDAFTKTDDKAANGYQAIGMQALLDAVRSTGAKNVVLVGGLDYAYDLSGMGKGFALEDKGGNGIVLSTHIYAQKKGWQEKVIDLADKYPIFVGELGANTKKFNFMPESAQEDATTWVPAVLGLIQKYNFHWTAFSLHPKSAPQLISDWNYTPTPEWGAFAKRALAGEKFTLDKNR
jgi:endoglucanase